MQKNFLEESQKKDHILLVESVRIGILIVLFFILMVKFFSQPQFINIDRYLPIYFILMTSFLTHSLYLIFFEKLFQNQLIHTFLLTYEILFISILAYFLRLSPSIYLFMYLINIFFSGFLLGKRRAFIIACLTSFFFHIVLLFFSSISEGALFFLVFINNLAFFVTASVSGHFGEEMFFIKKEVKRRGKDIQALKNFNQIIVENIHTGLITVSEEGEVLYSNAIAEDILETSRLKGCSLKEKVPTLQEVIHQLKWASYKNSSFSYEIKGSLKRTKEKREPYSNFSKRKYIEVSVSPSFDLPLKARGYVILLQDRTETKKLEMLLRQKEKMAAVGQLAAGIAHEIRNPLAGISGSVQMMLNSFEKEEKNKEEDKKREQQDPSHFSSEEMKKLSHITLREIERLNELISEFLNYVKSEDYPLSLIDLNQVLKSVLETFRVNTSLSTEIQQQIRLSKKSLILGHENKLKQVFLNFFINAYQAMEDAKKPCLTVEVSNDEEKKEVCVKISDNGKGMSEETISHIFEPFYTTKEKGTGLGLSLTHKILEKHEAKVHVESQLNQGTSFLLCFSLHNLEERSKNGI